MRQRRTPSLVTTNAQAPIEVARELLEIWDGAACAGLDPVTFDARRDEIPTDPEISNAVRIKMYKESVEWRKYRERAAKRACGPCPVILQCAAWALDNERDSEDVWGGQTPRDRDTYRDRAATLKAILADSA